MIVRKHVSQDGRLILAVCDKSIIGKKFSEKNLQLDLSSDFYNGKEMDESDAAELMKKAFVINLVGEKSIALAQKLNFMDKENAVRIKGIPHAQVLFAEDL